MTTEEKAKAYDEALAKCKAYIEDTKKRWSEEFCKATEKVFEEIFPQLAESEDERIINAIIGILKNSNVIDINVSQEKMVAWLEKQKEQKLSIVEKLREISTPADEDWFEIQKRWEKEDEQKPVQTDDEKEYIRTLKSLISDFIRDKQPADVAFYQKIYDWLDGRHVEQKAAQTSEEKDNIKTLIQVVRGQLGLSECRQEYIVNWLKSLRPQYHGDVTMTEAYKMGLEAGKASSWKPFKVEERLINTSISFLKDFADKGYENAVECIDWLKSKLK